MTSATTSAGGLLLVLLAGSAAPAVIGGPDAPHVPAIVASRAQHARDTTVALRRGERVVVAGLSGEVRVTAWGQDRVRFSETGREERVGIRRTEGRLELRVDGTRRQGSYQVTVPEWAAVQVAGEVLDVSVEGVRGGIEVQVVSGDVRVRRGAGGIRLHTVEGEVHLEDSEGPAELVSVDDDIRVRGLRGHLTATGTDGDVHVEDADGGNVHVATVDGDVHFAGRLSPGGSYRLATHDGDLVVFLPEGTGARVSVSTFDGDFESEFPVVAERFQGGRQLSFTLGGGGSELVLQAFDGEIRLRRR